MTRDIGVEMYELGAHKGVFRSIVMGIGRIKYCIVCYKLGYYIFMSTQVFKRVS